MNRFIGCLAFAVTLALFGCPDPDPDPDDDDDDSADDDDDSAPDS